MAKHEVSGYVTYQRCRYTDAVVIGFQTWEPDAKYSPEKVVVKQDTITVEVPDDFDPRPALVEKLKNEQQKIRAEMSARIKELDDRINSLLALEM